MNKDNMDINQRLETAKTNNQDLLPILAETLPEIGALLCLRNNVDARGLGSCIDRIARAQVTKRNGDQFILVAIENTSWSGGRNGGGIGKQLQVLCFKLQTDGTTSRTATPIVDTQPRHGGYRTEYTPLAHANAWRLVTKRGQPKQVAFLNREGTVIGQLALT